MRYLRIAALLLVLALGWLIGWLNSTPVEFALPGWSSAELPVFIFYFAFLAAGLLIGFVVGWLSRR